MAGKENNEKVDGVVTRQQKLAREQEEALAREKAAKERESALKNGGNHHSEF